MEPMRFGIVGCGGIAQIHADSLDVLASEGLAVLVAGAETHEGRAKEFSERWGVPVHGSLAELLARDDIDAVAVCTPSGLHGDETIEIARSGRHILCEKPGDVVASKVAEGVRVAKEKGVVFGGIFQQRYTAGALKVKKAVDEGYFGHITFVHCETPWLREQGYYDSGDWRGTWALDCGVLSNQGPHMVDRLLWLGGDVDDVIAATCETRDRKIEAETVAVATIRLVNGALGTITGTTLAYPGLAQRVLICGSEGSAAFVGDDLVSFATKRPFEYEPPADILPHARPEKVDADGRAAKPLGMSSDMHAANYRNFVTSVRAGKRPLVTGEDQYRVCRTLNLIYKRAGVGPYASM
ncbi:MAG: Gfo/Idh/MocA family oxidoreductase [Capsulimonadaceae bacterium]|nr:Gfo/Idh/MocA family oxidoreductase [Capsulimonadaceae bacterium]